jgi:hypothetical protein
MNDTLNSQGRITKLVPFTIQKGAFNDMTRAQRTRVNVCQKIAMPAGHHPLANDPKSVCVWGPRRYDRGTCASGRRFM